MVSKVSLYVFILDLRKSSLTLFREQMMPIQGAEAGGAAGFFKGFGKGLVGYVLLSFPSIESED